MLKSSTMCPYWCQSCITMCSLLGPARSCHASYWRREKRAYFPLVLRWNPLQKKIGSPCDFTLSTLFQGSLVQGLWSSDRQCENLLDVAMCQPLNCHTTTSNIAPLKCGTLMCLQLWFVIVDCQYTWLLGPPIAMVDIRLLTFLLSLRLSSFNFIRP